MKISTFFLLISLVLSFSSKGIAQSDDCNLTYKKHSIDSEYLEQSREFWVSLPMNYDPSKKYPVLYVLDAEWRFDLVRTIEFDLAGNKKIPGHIIVGIPHIDWEKQRGIDLTFSHSRIEYDGEAVDSSWYNASNSGGGMKFYNYLTAELIPAVDKQYATKGENILIGHSYGGYFGAYLLSMGHPFSALQIYDPSIWYSNGEVIKAIEKGMPKKGAVEVYISYQPAPQFHNDKVEELIEKLKKEPHINIHFRKFQNETHNSLYIYSFMDGIMKLYQKESMITTETAFKPN